MGAQGIGVGFMLGFIFAFMLFTIMNQGKGVEPAPPTLQTKQRPTVDHQQASVQEPTEAASVLTMPTEDPPAQPKYVPTEKPIEAPAAEPPQAPAAAPLPAPATGPTAAAAVAISPKKPLRKRDRVLMMNPTFDPVVWPGARLLGGRGFNRPQVPPRDPAIVAKVEVVVCGIQCLREIHTVQSRDKRQVLHSNSACVMCCGRGPSPVPKTPGGLDWGTPHPPNPC